MKIRNLALTPIQLTILNDKAEGWSLKEIAHRRGRSLNQIRSQWHSGSGVLAKLGAVNDANVVLIAFRKGLIK